MKELLTGKLKNGLKRSAAFLLGTFLAAGAAAGVRAEEWSWDVILGTGEETAQAAEVPAEDTALAAEVPAADAAQAASVPDLSDVYTRYLAKLNEYGITIRSYSWQNPAKPVNLRDITGDGVPELFFLEGSPEGNVYTATLHIGTIIEGQYAETAYFPPEEGQFHHLSPGGGYHCFALTTGPDGSLLVFSAEGDADYAYEIWQIGSPFGGQAQVLQHVAFCDWRQEWSLNDTACTQEEASQAAAALYAAAGDMLLYSGVEVFYDQGLLNKSGQCTAGTIDEIAALLAPSSAAPEPAPEAAPGGNAGSLSEDQMRQILAGSGTDMGRLQYFLYDDYDGDGLYEAYALFCDISGLQEIQNFGTKFRIWFIASDGTLSDVSSLSVSGDQAGYLENGGFVYVPGRSDMGGAAPNSSAAEVLGQAGSHKFLTIECYYMGSGGTSYVFGVKNGQSYQPAVSGNSDFFGIENGVATATAHDFSEGYHKYLTVTYQFDEGSCEFVEISRVSLF